MITSITILFHVRSNINKPVTWSRKQDVVNKYRKAFDTVPHHRLLHKLQQLALDENLMKWLHSFLTDRLMRVVINGSASEWMAVLSGVPQGSVLGPLLFLLFINDLPDWIKANIRMFADDTKIWTQVTAAADMQILQTDLDSLSLWSKEWLLGFSPEKMQSYAHWAPVKIIIHHHTRR